MDKNNEKSYYSKLNGARKAMPILLVAASIFIFICFLTEGTGALGQAISTLLLGLFSYGAYLIPLALIVHAIFYAEDYAKKKLGARILFSVIAILAICIVEYTIYNWSADIAFNPGEAFTEAQSGGFIGTLFGFILMKLFGKFGVIVFSVALLLVYSILFFAGKTDSLRNGSVKVLVAIGNFFAFIRKAINNHRAKRASIQEQKEFDERVNKSDELLNDQFFEVEDGIKDVNIDGRDVNGKIKTPPSSQNEENTVEIKKPRKHKDIPLDLSYGLEQKPASQPKKETVEIAEEITKESSAPFESPALLSDESAENVFTKNFSPFNFAISEKVALKPSSKTVAIEEKLDDITMLEMRGEPTERDKRRAILEQRKAAWLERQKQKSATPDTSRIVTADNQVKKQPDSFEFKESTVADADLSQPDSDIARVAEIINNNIPKNVNVYTSYNTTQTTYTQPIKTVEFTVKNDKPVYSEPRESTPVTKIYDKGDLTQESTDDVAAFIAAKIAKQNPAYARSANDMVTYTKFTPSPEDDVAFAESPSTEAGENDTNTEAETKDFNSGMSFECVTDNEGLSYDCASPAISETDSIVADSEECSPSLQENGISDRGYEEAVDVDKDISVIDKDEEMPSFEFEVVEAHTFVDETTNIDSTENADSESKNFEFKPYTPPTAPTEEILATEESLTVERTMITPVTKPASSKEFGSTYNDGEKDCSNEQTDDSSTDELDFTLADDTLDGTDSAFAEEDAGIDITDATAPDEMSMFEVQENDPEEKEEDLEEISPDFFPEENVEMEEIPPEEQNPEILELRKRYSVLEPLPSNEELMEELPAENQNAESNIENDLQEEAPVPVSTEPALSEENEAETIDNPPFDDAVEKETPDKISIETGLVSIEEIEKENKRLNKPDYSDYEFPSIELLARDNISQDENIESEIQENANKLIETLASFGVSASIKGVDRGPRITRYEVVPARGVKVSSILNLQDDIALNLAAGSLRMEAPIPGKSAVGIEIPNKKAQTVRLRNLLETEEFRSAKSKTAVCIGRDVSGQPILGDIANMPHLLIAGATGMGKSVCINALMISILYKARPDEVKFIMIDPKQVEFTMYNGIPHLLVPVVSDAKQAAGALMWAVEEMERRYVLLNSLNVRNADAYNEKVTKDHSLGEPLSSIVIVIDEFADLMLQVKDPVETLVMRIAQKARAAGIYLIIGTQRPSVNVITGIIKANVPSRIACKVMSNVDSKTILDSAGAEKLLDRGDMLYAPKGSPKPHRVQGAFVADGEVEAIMAHLKKYSNGETYDSEVMEEITRAAQKCSKKGANEDRDEDDSEVHGEGYLNDRKFLDAVEIAVNTRKISTSLIQRKLSIGYGKAAKFIDIMEDMGIVGEANGQRPREVLLTPDEWREKLARATIDF